MKLHGGPFLAVAFGLLILLLGLSGTAMYRHVAYISREVAATQTSFRESERGLSDVRTQIYSLAVLVRDYLLDSSPAAAAGHRRQALELHSSIEKELDGLQESMGQDQAAAMLRLRQGAEEYWRRIDAMLQWSPAQKAAQGQAFLRDSASRRGTAVLSVADQIGAVNASYVQERQNLIMGAMEDLQRYLTRVLAVAIALGLVIAGSSMARMTVLENRAELHRSQVEQGRKELREISRRLVKAHEEERKSISRELHDSGGTDADGVAHGTRQSGGAPRLAGRGLSGALGGGKDPG